MNNLLFTPLLVALVLMASVAGAGEPSDAAADDAVVQARAHFQKGAAAMEAGDCVSAESHFEKALALHKHYQIAGNLGACELELKKYKEAAEHLQLALVELRREQGRAEQLATVEQMYERTRLHVATVRIAVDGPGAADAIVIVDGEEVAAAGAVFVTPGKHRIAARTAAAEASEVTVSVAAGETVAVALSLEPTAAPATADEADDESSIPIIPILMWSSYGLAVVATGVGAGTFAAGSVAQSDADTCRAEPRSGCFALVDMYEEAAGYYNASVVSFAVGGAAAVAGTVFLVMDLMSDEGDEPAVGVVPLQLTEDAAVLGVSGRF